MENRLSPLKFDWQKANDKGKVEGLAKYSWANFLTPLPHAPSIEAFDARLAERRLARRKERAGRHELTILEGIAADEAMFRELAAMPFAPHKVTTKVSAPVARPIARTVIRFRRVMAFATCWRKGFVAEIVIFCDGVEIARHTRSYAWRRLHLHAGGVETATRFLAEEISHGFQTDLP